MPWSGKHDNTKETPGQADDARRRQAFGVAADSEQQREQWRGGVEGASQAGVDVLLSPGVKKVRGDVGDNRHDRQVSPGHQPARERLPAEGHHNEHDNRGSKQPAKNDLDRAHALQRDLD